MSWILPEPVHFKLENVRTHFMDKPLKKFTKATRKYKKVKIGGRVYSSISSASKQYRRHHSVIEGWIKNGKAVLV